jgi:hypothetical protein
MMTSSLAYTRRQLFNLKHSLSPLLKFSYVDILRQSGLLHYRGKRGGQSFRTPKAIQPIRKFHPSSIKQSKWSLPTILNANVRSLFNKLDDFETVLHTNNADIACLTESMLSDEIPSEAVSMNGFTLFRKDRNRHGGGVACYVRNELPCSRLQHLENDSLESLWLLLRSARMPRWMSHIALGVIYNPPWADDRAMSNHIISCIDDITRTHPYAGVVVLGDFNRLRDAALRAYPLKQIVTEPTRDNAILDKIFTNVSEWYDSPVILPQIGRSDHKAVLMQPSGTGLRCRVQPTTRLIRVRDQNGMALLADALKNVNWSTMYRMDKCDDMVEFFYKMVLTLLDHFLPVRKVSTNANDKPWVTEQFRRLIRCRQYALTHRQLDQYRLLRNQTNRLAIKLRKSYYEAKLQNLRQSDSHNWWRRMKQFTGQTRQSELTGLANNIANGSLQNLAETINSSLTAVSDDLSPLCDTIRSTSDHIPAEYTIYPETIFHRLESINVRKAPGPDGMPNWVLKQYSSLLCEPVCAIFNACIQQGCCPMVWKMADVLPIPKVHPPVSVQSDLRPISLTPTISKQLESIVGRWILLHVTSQIDKRQYGSLKGRSTTHALIDIVHHWSKALDEGRSVRALFVDYAKAFDHVDHSTVLRKLNTYDVPEFMIKWLSSFLTNRQQRVKIGDVLSDWLSLRGGIPQGSWLGPLTFLILIDDLQPQILTHKYVDDTTLSEILARGESSQMQTTLDNLLQWSETNYMSINCKKTKEMILGPLRKQPPPPLLISDQNVQQVTSFKLLGVTMNDALKWDDHIAAVTSKAAKRLWFLKKLKRAGVSQADLVYYYQAVIRPVLEYACPVWHTSITDKQSKQLDLIQRRACQIIVTGASYIDACTILGLNDLKERRQQQCQKLFDKLIRNNDSCLSYLLPEKRDVSVTSRLRSANKLPLIFAKTSKFKNSFICYGLSHYQAYQA